MTNRELENKIASAFDNIVPSDSFEKISEKIYSASSNERSQLLVTKKNKIFKFIVPAIAACVLIIAGFSFGVYYQNNFATESIIDIDVNPGIEMNVNKNNTVIDVHAVNDDGEKVLDGINLKSTDLDVAVNEIISSMVHHGYVADETTGILVTVRNDDTDKAAELQTEISSQIDSALQKNNVEAALINQTVTHSSDAEKLAEECGISVGKAAFILNIIQKDNSLDAKNLANMSISEIACCVNEMNIDISDIADYDANDCIWDNIANSIHSENKAACPDENISYVDESCIEAVQKAVLEHAGHSEDDIEYISTEYYCDDGNYKYNVEVVWHGVAFEYDVDAVTGEICLISQQQVDIDGQMAEVNCEDQPKNEAHNQPEDEAHNQPEDEAHNQPEDKAHNQPEDEAHNEYDEHVDKAHDEYDDEHDDKHH